MNQAEIAEIVQMDDAHRGCAFKPLTEPALDALGLKRLIEVFAFCTFCSLTLSLLHRTNPVAEVAEPVQTVNPT